MHFWALKNLLYTNSIKKDFTVFYSCFLFDFIREKLVEEFLRNPTGPMVSVKVP